MVKNVYWKSLFKTQYEEKKNGFGWRSHNYNQVKISFKTEEIGKKKRGRKKKKFKILLEFLIT